MGDESQVWARGSRLTEENCTGTLFLTVILQRRPKETARCNKLVDPGTD